MILLLEPQKNDYNARFFNGVVISMLDFQVNGLPTSSTPPAPPPNQRISEIQKPTVFFNGNGFQLPKVQKTTESTL